MYPRYELFCVFFAVHEDRELIFFTSIKKKNRAESIARRRDKKIKQAKNNVIRPTYHSIKTCDSVNSTTSQATAYIHESNGLTSTTAEEGASDGSDSSALHLVVNSSATKKVYKNNRKGSNTISDASHKKPLQHQQQIDLVVDSDRNNNKDRSAFTIHTSIAADKSAGVSRTSLSYLCNNPLRRARGLLLIVRAHFNN